jgi:hypothetical protein
MKARINAAGRRRFSQYFYDEVGVCGEQARMNRRILLFFMTILSFPGAAQNNWRQAGHHCFCSNGCLAPVKAA